MTNIIFFEKEYKLHFEIPQNKSLEERVRASVKTQSVPLGKKEFFFKQGIKDAVKSIEQGTPRQLGTPIVELKDPFTGETKQVTCHEAKVILNNIGGTYLIRQISGSPLAKDYFTQQ